MANNKNKYSLSLIIYTLIMLFPFTTMAKSSMKTYQHHLEVLAEDSKNIESLRYISMYYLNQGHFEKAIEYANQLMEVGTSQKNTKQAVVYAHICLGQALMMTNRTNSFQAYNHLKQAEAISEIHLLDSALCSVYNGLGLYATNIQKDYAGALKYFFKGTDAAKRSNYSRLHCILLCNISGIYHLQKDTTGLVYTQKCYKIGHLKHDPFLIYIGAIRTASMLNLKKDYQGALEYIKEAEFLMQQNDFKDQAEVYSLYGNILSNLNEKKEAKTYFKQALSKREESKISSILSSYLEYADLLIKHNNMTEAIKLLQEGINYSSSTPSAVYRSDLILKLSNCYEKNGQNDKALAYYKQYKSETDSMFNIEKERSADELRVKYNIEQAENAIKQSKLELLEKEKKMHLLLFFLLAILIASSFVYYSYYRNKRLYKAIVRQNQEAIQRELQLKERINSMQTIPETTTLQAKYAYSSLNEEKKQDLFQALEKLMTEKHIYTDNLLTKDKVAELLGSNRTYLSQIINERTGKSFTQYINDYRIQDAIRQLSDPDNQIPLKVLSLELGFNSSTTFYKQFQTATGMTPAQYRNQVLELTKEPE